MIRLKQIAAILVLVAVAFVAIAPLLDLEPTALRASRAAQLALLALAGPASIIIAICAPTFSDRHTLTVAPQYAGVSVVDVTCARLC